MGEGGLTVASGGITLRLAGEGRTIRKDGK